MCGCVCVYVFQRIRIYAHGFMNKQYVEGVQKWRNTKLMRVGNIDM